MTAKKDATRTFSVRWPIWLIEKLDEYCEREERTRNWMIKKRMAEALGLSHNVSDAPSVEDDV